MSVLLLTGERRENVRDRTYETHPTKKTETLETLETLETTETTKKIQTSRIWKRVSSPVSSCMTHGIHSRRSLRTRARRFVGQGRQEDARL